MNRLFLLLAVACLAVACEPDDGPNIPDDPNTETPIPDPDPDPTPEPEPEPEPDPTPDPDPEDILSTLDGDLEVIFDPDCSMCYADCFGDYYATGMYMWGFYFQNYTTKEQLYIEVMHSAQEYVIPLGQFTATDNIYRDNALLIGQIDFEGYQVYSWYTSLATQEHEAHLAPIVEGTMTIEYVEESDIYTATFDLKDDAGNSITGSYSHRMVLEDFRI